MDVWVIVYARVGNKPDEVNMGSIAITAVGNRNISAGTAAKQKFGLDYPRRKIISAYAKEIV